MAASSQRRILVTCGAGFVGANLAIALSRAESADEIVALDNLSRRGSELNLPRLRQAGVRFEHADIRSPEDLARLPSIDVLIECSAEPSVLAGFEGPDRMVRTNLLGAWNCLELARRDEAYLVFLSTSRVYPLDALNRLELSETETRFEISQPAQGASSKGISEDFSLAGARTLYGTSKLCAELLIEECRASTGLRAVVDRCGVIAGPWQMGKVDQGVFTHWLLSHRFGLPLSYIGYGGSGKQVRDLLHIDDLVELVRDQLERQDHWEGVVANVGGGANGSLSLKETTAICQELSGAEVPIEPELQARPGDVPIYISDCSRLFALTDWRPSRAPREILGDIWSWICEHEAALKAAL
jgi:CDP-paratose 2-epimerase